MGLARRLLVLFMRVCNSAGFHTSRDALSRPSRSESLPGTLTPVAGLVGGPQVRQAAARQGRLLVGLIGLGERETPAVTRSSGIMGSPLPSGKSPIVCVWTPSGALD